MADQLQNNGFQQSYTCKISKSDSSLGSEWATVTVLEKKTPTKLPECVVESPSIKKRPDKWSTDVDLGLPDFPQ